MENVLSPCKDCKLRKPMCHDSCEKYAEYKNTKDKIKAGRAEFMKERSIVVESVTRQRKSKIH